ncbi:hypothetical protein [Pontibacter akesuensis]|uniref:SpoIIAA-like n=1 Tax=Pontibacter akesuensis TaxID=388950 RepID=A0A1I7KQR1_9BACT|nr:hypothetical protein [Pontibacter akesuensis]GHA81321.1 hypothetical protein GCM10007389_39810 [Pontibacter akesuensis]SFU99750.1 hypothetical protein SAMN04487941_3998 [Pontibacter akesuensis]
MIIPSPVIRLDYNPATDVLSVEWPDVREHSLGEAEHLLDVVVQAVRLYDVRYLLTDTRKGVVDVPEQRYRELLLRFTRSLAATRVRKLARVVTVDTLREGPISQVTRESALAVPIRSFYSTEEALGWLTSK